MITSDERSDLIEDAEDFEERHEKAFRLLSREGE